MHATYPLQSAAITDPVYPWRLGSSQPSPNDLLHPGIGNRLSLEEMASFPGPCYAFDPSIVYPYFGSYCNADVRRKNATRESTSTLKAWLYEHRKNPYPTKGEKIMLAIITKMTLTQVSTWFANARRRLKKENKGEWGFKDSNDAEEDIDDDDDDDLKEGDATETISSRDYDSSLSTTGTPELRLSLPPLSSRQYSPVSRSHSVLPAVVPSSSHSMHHIRVTPSRTDIDTRQNSQEEALDISPRFSPYRPSSPRRCLTPTIKQEQSNSRNPPTAPLPPNKPKLWSVDDMVAPSPSKSRPVHQNPDDRESDHPGAILDPSRGATGSSGLFASNSSLGSGSLCFSGAQLALANGTYNQYILQLAAAAGAASSGYHGGPMLRGESGVGSLYGDYVSSTLSPASYAWFKHAAYDSRGTSGVARDSQPFPGPTGTPASLANGAGSGLINIGPMQRRLAEQQQLHLLKQFQLKQQQ